MLSASSTLPPSLSTSASTYTSQHVLPGTRHSAARSRPDPAQQPQAGKWIERVFESALADKLGSWEMCVWADTLLQRSLDSCLMLRGRNVSDCLVWSN
jgi:hypothetical protein